MGGALGWVKIVEVESWRTSNNGKVDGVVDDESECTRSREGDGFMFLGLKVSVVVLL